MYKLYTCHYTYIQNTENTNTNAIKKQKYKYGTIYYHPVCKRPSCDVCTVQPKMHISAGVASVVCSAVVHPPVKVVVYKKLCKTDFDCNLLLHCCALRTIVIFTIQCCCDICNDVFNDISYIIYKLTLIAIYCCIAAHHHNVATVLECTEVRAMI